MMTALVLTFLGSVLVGEGVRRGFRDVLVVWGVALLSGAAGAVLLELFQLVCLYPQFVM
ncbi:MAG TPA: hypothetical protein VMU82_13800 [Acetobacteraceae bacterium]|nr:hypothetical protein [Acetobacteraceae bacterium]